MSKDETKCLVLDPNSSWKRKFAKGKELFPRVFASASKNLQEYRLPFLDSAFSEGQNQLERCQCIFFHE
jgi:hypothetical protein